MMKIKVLINGIGRIGKAILKQLQDNSNFQVVMINDINPYVENIVYSINYDSTWKIDKFKIIDGNHISNSKSK